MNYSILTDLFSSFVSTEANCLCVLLFNEHGELLARSSSESRNDMDDHGEIFLGTREGAISHIVATIWKQYAAGARRVTLKPFEQVIKHVRPEATTSAVSPSLTNPVASPQPLPFPSTTLETLSWMFMEFSLGSSSTMVSCCVTQLPFSTKEDDSRLLLIGVFRNDLEKGIQKMALTQLVQQLGRIR